MIIGIGHAAYTVRDMRATLRFYCDQLGLQHAFSLKDAHDSPWIEYIKVADGQFLEFFYAKADELGTSPESYRHLCLLVDDIHAECARIEANGAKLRIQPKQGRDGNWQAWIVDPDGNQIELMQIAPNAPQARA